VVYFLALILVSVEAADALEPLRRRHNGLWGERYDARLHLDASRRILNKEEPDYAS
jgi:hypothetical protein